MRKIIIVGRIEFFMILLVLLFSCQDSDKNIGSFTFKEDKKVIDFSTEILTPKFSSFSIHSENQEDYHLYVDPHNTLVVTHLQSMKLFKHIPIQIGDGPDL